MEQQINFKPRTAQTRRVWQQKVLSPRHTRRAEKFSLSKWHLSVFGEHKSIWLKSSFKLNSSSPPASSLLLLSWGASDRCTGATCGEDVCGAATQLILKN
jgi:hypothetical protein